LNDINFLITTKQYMKAFILRIAIALFVPSLVFYSGCKKSYLDLLPHGQPSNPTLRKSLILLKQSWEYTQK